MAIDRQISDRMAATLRRGDDVPEPQSDAAFSVLIATMRRPQTLRMTMDSVAWQRGRFAGSELIVVDNDAEQSARAAVEEWTPPAGWTVRYLCEPCRGKVHALNMGIDAVRRELVCLLDDDIVLFPDALAAYQRAASEWPDVDYFGGSYLPVCPEGIPKGCAISGPHRLYLVWPTHNLGPDDHIYSPSESPMGGNRLIRKRLFDRGVRFDARFLAAKLYASPADDMFFGAMLRQMGAAAVYVAGAQALHMTLRQSFTMCDLWRRYVAFGRYQVLATEPAKRWIEHRYAARELARELLGAVGARLAGRGEVARYHWSEAARDWGIVRQLTAVDRTSCTPQC